MIWDIINSLLQLIISWPVAIVVLGLVFREPISDFLRRIKSGRAFGVEFNAALRQADINTDMIKPKTTPGTEVANSTELVSHLAFERIYNRTYGTQLLLLKSLQQKKVDGKMDFTPADYYAEYLRRGGSPMYQMRDYVGFLVKLELIEYEAAEDPNQLGITEYGTKFLDYLAAQYGVNYTHRNL